MPNSFAYTILALVHQFIGILPVLRNIPDIVANNPCRVTQFLEKTLGFLRALFHRRCSSQDGEPEERESAHLVQLKSNQEESAEKDDLATKKSRHSLQQRLYYIDFPEAAARTEL